MEERGGRQVVTRGALDQVGGTSRKHMWLGAILGLWALSLVSCTAPSQYMGITLVSGAADPPLQSLAHRARAGDKRAQLELGVRFENGVGVPRDFVRARSLYRAAAQEGAGPMWIYSAPAGKGQVGRVIQISPRFPQPGLPEAAKRLQALESNKKTPQ